MMRWVVLSEQMISKSNEYSESTIKIGSTIISCYKNTEIH